MKQSVIAMSHYTNSKGFVGGIRTKAWIDQATRDGWNAYLISPGTSGSAQYKAAKRSRSFTGLIKNRLLRLGARLRPHTALVEPSNAYIFFYMKEVMSLIKRIAAQKANPHPIILVSSYSPAVTVFAGFLIKAIYKSKVHWVVDYRDDWSTNYKKKYLFPRVEQLIERKLVSICDSVFTVSEEYARVISVNLSKNVFVVRNGFDGHSFIELRKRQRENQSDGYIIRYVGTLNAWRSGLEVACSAISESSSEENAMILEVAGKADDHARAILKTHEIGYYGLLDHSAALELMASSDALLFFDTGVAGEISSKVYEYLATHKPVIVYAANDHVVCEDILREAGILAGVFRNKREAVVVLRKLKSFRCDPNIEFINRFTRENQAREFLSIVAHPSVCHTGE